MYVDDQEEAVKPFPWKWNHLKLKDYGSCIKADFGFSDVMRMLEDANTPILEANQEVIVVFKGSASKVCWVRKMVTSERIDTHCSTMLTIENPKEEEE